MRRLILPIDGVMQLIVEPGIWNRNAIRVTIDDPDDTYEETVCFEVAPEGFRAVADWWDARTRALLEERGEEEAAS